MSQQHLGSVADMLQKSAKLMWLAGAFLMFSALACKPVPDTSPIQNSVASPTDVAVSPDGQYFYVLNADYDRSFTSGSILVIKQNGEKVGAVSTPRMGRKLAISGTDMLALFDKTEEESSAEIRLYSLKANPEIPELVTTWAGGDYDCAPINAVMVKDYQHFAVTCQGGRIFLGTLADDRAATTLKFVRQYDHTRRAIYIDASRELLFTFVTDFGRQESGDHKYDDAKSYDPTTGRDSPGANEIPDELESSRARRRQRGTRRQYQFTVYNIGKERQARDKQGDPFPFRSADNEKDATVTQEYRWLYFTLKDFDGTPDSDAGMGNSTFKHYRTNFYEAKPDPFDPNAFYLSHRGRLTDEHTKNTDNIIRVTIKNDVAQTSPEILKTADVLDFQRVYGFSGELREDNRDQVFPGDFQVVAVNGRTTLIVNHFKDLRNFQKAPSFMIVAKLLDGGFWRGEIQSGDRNDSFYHVAFNQSGRGLTGAFYGAAVIPLEVTPGTDIKVGWDNINRIQ